MAHKSQKLINLFEFKRTATGATIFGKYVRVDETGEFLSVKDCIAVIIKCNAESAQKKLIRMKTSDIIVCTQPGIQYFKDDCYPVLGARLDMIAYMCFHLKSECARAVTKAIFEIGVQYLVRDQVRLQDSQGLAPMAHISQELMTLLEYKRTATGATIFGKAIRVDETGEFSSVQDCIATIDKCSAHSANYKLNYMKANGIIDCTQLGVTRFKHDEVSMILGARLDMVAYVCFHLKNERARAVIKRIFEIGIRCLVEEHEPLMILTQRKEATSTTDLSFARRCTREKERAVVEYIKQEFGSDGWVFDKSIDANNGYRPDALFRMSSHAIVVEVDENQHRGYDVKEEYIRIKKIQEDVGTPVIFIRFNPDKYVDNYGQTHISRWKFDANGVYFAHNQQNWAARLQTLRANILKYMGLLSSDSVSEVRLFFSNSNKRKHTEETGSKTSAQGMCNRTVSGGVFWRTT
jgi:uncharacterized metal-binding protein